LISCPTCGRKRIEVRTIVDLVTPFLESLPDGVTVAVMGCEVNGPREAMDADFGIAGSPRGAVVFSKGTVLKEVPLEMVPELLEQMAEETRRQKGNEEDN
ncbi:MAG TPA: flavodoxin-dependent (E)-4-hydroxy-3-methylbut-2-enyl-diphosphate synthase, partial [Aminivibrio sp.]